MTSQMKMIDNYEVSRSRNPNVKFSSAGYHILIIDNDSDYLAKISEQLRNFKYEVVSVKNELDGLRAIREKKIGAFDLVLTDDSSASIGGLDFISHVYNVLRIPIALMSSETNYNVQIQALAKGASVCYTKPLSVNMARTLWQISFTTKKRMNANPVKEEMDDMLSINGENSKGSRQKRKKIGEVVKTEAVEVEIESPVSKKRKFFTVEQQDLFLDAVKSVGHNNATPEKIFEMMKAPGLTREDVADTLQRLHRLAEHVGDSFEWLIQKTVKDIDRAAIFPQNL